jgi:hypothetical protein
VAAVSLSATPAESGVGNAAFCSSRRMIDQRSALALALRCVAHGELLAAENLPRPSFNGVVGRRFRTKEIANGVPLAW